LYGTRCREEDVGAISQESNILDEMKTARDNRAQRGTGNGRADEPKSRIRRRR
jgi:hypothetical protein